ncbi:hypothetical protein IQ276_012240 [Desmonostoc muscorum LEGE 12446]|uniref:Uncharacterized protein n=1 Tax=Desmonostoc muscorum LEGE 12446 TaxID=1828758 RepID=A0A8J7DI42_DESMC|nr:hypothetical protein [Desmonostoc muscorum]MCF2147201.1 hypothetical protein [Desmonostoc muscorum LEGE 12446]
MGRKTLTSSQAKRAATANSTANAQCPILLYERLRQRQLLETLRVACFPVGIRSVQVSYAQ